MIIISNWLVQRLQFRYGDVAITTKPDKQEQMNPFQQIELYCYKQSQMEFESRNAIHIPVAFEPSHVGQTILEIAKISNSSKLTLHIAIITYQQC